MGEFRALFAQPLVGRYFGYLVASSRKGPRDYFLSGKKPSGAASEAYVSLTCSDRTRNIHGPTYSEGICCIRRIRNRHGQSCPVVRHVNLENVSGVKVDSSAQRHCRNSWRSPIEVQAG